MNEAWFIGVTSDLANIIIQVTGIQSAHNNKNRARNKYPCFGGKCSTLLNFDGEAKCPSFREIRR